MHSFSSKSFSSLQEIVHNKNSMLKHTPPAQTDRKPNFVQTSSMDGATESVAAGAPPFTAEFSSLKTKGKITFARQLWHY